VARKRPSLSSVAQREAPTQEAPKTAPPAPAKEEPAKQQTTTVYGKRADPTYTQLSATVPKNLKVRFKAAVALDGKDINTVVEELLEAYLKGR